MTVARIVLVSYGTMAFYPSLSHLAVSAHRHGIGQINLWSPSSLRNSDFYRRNSRILQQKRGGGYWLWKPHIILETMKRAADGDIIVYSDAGIKIIAPLIPLIEIAQTQPIILFSSGAINRYWTKRDAFILLDADTPRYYDAPQLIAGFLVFRNGTTARQFVGEWLRAMEDERVLTDMPNTLGEDNLPEFRDHRHDQSVLSILAVREDIEVYRDPSQWGNKRTMVNSSYPQLLLHHRQKYRGVKMLQPHALLRCAHAYFLLRS